MNIRWVQGLAGPARGRARAVPAGGLWPVLPLDRRTARAETVYGMLERGGALALIVRTVTVRPGKQAPGVPSVPHAGIKALVQKYLGSARRAGSAICFPRAGSPRRIRAVFL
jgi:hypothetical protein